MRGPAEQLQNRAPQRLVRLVHRALSPLATPALCGVCLAMRLNPARWPEPSVDRASRFGGMMEAFLPAAPVPVAVAALLAAALGVVVTVTSQ